MAISDETKDRFNAAVGVAKVSLASTVLQTSYSSFYTSMGECDEESMTIVTVGWIPFVIYVGYKNSYPQPSLIKLITPLA
ncbi:uncharacterized protein MKK02DRAFT_39819 [Dioszegia hungarica]|uniref:Tom7-domain-containing protein n=1 Tax=Dioszegia hungarica TaxID=4972 RepID=A0AA38HG95_9TREE|nr:uncharacterized protein MKK02DRAFT_39819 [Dioszegia hungarica]KAI9639513.1 hypothetical protein MKK02DRAFT_39819 [Dioszegia hungarica]